MATYQEFLKSKRNVVRRVGFDVDAGAINPMLFDWQRQVVAWALRRGLAAATLTACVTFDV